MSDAPQGLRWWQEAEQETRSALPSPLLPSAATSTENVETTAVEISTDDLLDTLEFRDIGEELEAEARLRALKEQQLAVETIAFTMDPARLCRLVCVGMLRLSAIAGLIWTTLAFTVLRGLFHPDIREISGAVLGWLVLNGTWALLISFTPRRSALPALTVSSEGVRFCSELRDTGVIRWSEIVGLRTRKLPWQPCADIVIRLRDRSALDRIQYRTRRLRPGIRIRRTAGQPEAVYLTLPGYLLPMDAEPLVERLLIYDAEQTIKAGAASTASD